MGLQNSPSTQKAVIGDAHTVYEAWKKVKK